MHVLALTAHVGLLGLNGADEQAGFLFEGQPQPMQHELGSFLADTQLAMQPHQRNALGIRREQVDPDRPCRVLEIRPFHDGVGAR